MPKQRDGKLGGGKVSLQAALNVLRMASNDRTTCLCMATVSTTAIFRGYGHADDRDNGIDR